MEGSHPAAKSAVGFFCKKCSKICNAQNLNGLMIGNYAAKIPDDSVNKPAVYIIFSVY